MQNLSLEETPMKLRVGKVVQFVFEHATVDHHRIFGRIGSGQHGCSVGEIFCSPTDEISPIAQVTQTMFKLMICGLSAVAGVALLFRAFRKTKPVQKPVTSGGVSVIYDNGVSVNGTDFQPTVGTVDVNGDVTVVSEGFCSPAFGIVPEVTHTETDKNDFRILDFVFGLVIFLELAVTCVPKLRALC